MRKKSRKSHTLLFCLLFMTNSLFAERDPTEPLVATQRHLEAEEEDSSEIEDLDLTSIFISKERRLAIINGEMLQEGEKVEGFTVKEIKKDQVILEKGEQAVKLRILDVTVRKAKE